MCLHEKANTFALYLATDLYCTCVYMCMCVRMLCDVHGMVFRCVI